jgi:hypothetical protein
MRAGAGMRRGPWGAVRGRGTAGMMFFLGHDQGRQRECERRTDDE